MKSEYISFIFLLILSNSVLPTISAKNHRCGVDLLKKPKRVLVDVEKDNMRNLKNSSWEQFRVHFDFSYLNNNKDKISLKDYTDITEKIMPKTKEVLEKLFKVRRLNTKLKLNAPNCDVYPIPEEYLEGVDADIVIFVIVDISGYYLENQIEAAAAHCLQNSENRRPIAGYIQIKPYLNVNDSIALDYMTWLVLHEITHILVLNTALYDDFINSETLLPLGYRNILGKSTREDGSYYVYLKSPKVLEKARKHFGCATLQGVPLESIGGTGTVGSHWSKKYMNTDYMIGDSYGENLISEISLALFEDSGWYQIDYSVANLFLWGKNKGCEFFSKRCGEPIEDSSNEMKSNFKEEFCDNSNMSTCSISNIFRGTCKTYRYFNQLKTTERYFKDPYLGGFDELTEKCPIPHEIPNDATYYPGSCRVGQISSSNSNFEKICPECACFLTSNKKEITKKENLKFYFKQSDPLMKNKSQAGCFEFKCEGSELYVLLDEKKIKCRNGESISINGYDRNIICPNSENLCHPQYECKFGCTEKYKNISN